jgi:hypothetical protein
MQQLTSDVSTGCARPLLQLPAQAHPRAAVCAQRRACSGTQRWPRLVPPAKQAAGTRPWVIQHLSCCSISHGSGPGGSRGQKCGEAWSGGQGFFQGRVSSSSSGGRAGGGRDDSSCGRVWAHQQAVWRQQHCGSRSRWGPASQSSTRYPSTFTANDRLCCRIANVLPRAHVVAGPEHRHAKLQCRRWMVCACVVATVHFDNVTDGRHSST